MNIVILCKRAPQNKDIWTRPNGRFFYLAKCLAVRGHDVHFVLLNYRRETEFAQRRDGFTWHSVNLFPNPLRYYRYVKRLASDQDVDWFIAFSDTYFGICAGLIGRRLGARVLIDAYDNYESYLSWCAPLHWMWRRALRRASALSAAGPGLLEIMSLGRTDQNTQLLEMAADPQFSPGDKRLARKSLGLPEEGKLVTYCGSLYRSRGVDELFALIRRLGQSHPDIAWVMSGRLEEGVRLPENCLYLGYLADEKVVDVLRSADLVLCVNKPGEFGDYSYPVKIYEALSVGVPVIAFRTDSVDFVMRHNLEGLVEFGDIDAMARRIGQMLEKPYEVASGLGGWDAQGEQLHRSLSDWSKVS